MADDVDFEPADTLDEDTMTVTVCLDEDEQQPELRGEPQPLHHHIDINVHSVFDQVGPPTRVADLRCAVEADVRIRDLPQMVRDIMKMRLNPPAIGTMRNWEYVAMLLGMSMDEINHLRQSADPTLELTRAFADQPLNRLLMALRDTNRVDVLISLQPFLGGLRASRQALKSHGGALADSALFMEDGGSSVDDGMGALALRAVPGPSTRPPALPAPAALPQLPPNLILVTHHEPEEPDPTAKPARRAFRYFLRNLQLTGAPLGFNVWDVNACMNEQNLNAHLVNVFRHATHIVLYVSAAYRTQVYERRPEQCTQLVQLKRLLDDLMSEEYMAQQNRNRRFRVVLADEADEVHRPLGWPITTLNYRFPDHWKSLCARLFQGAAVDEHALDEASRTHTVAELGTGDQQER